MPNINRLNLSVNNIEFNPYWSIIAKFLQTKSLDTFEVHLLNEVELEDEKLCLIESNVRRIKIFNKILSESNPPWSLVDAPQLESVEVVGCTAGFAAAKGRVSASKRGKVFDLTDTLLKGLEPKKVMQLSFCELGQPQIHPWAEIPQTDCPYDLYIEPNSCSTILDIYDYILGLGLKLYMTKIRKKLAKKPLKKTQNCQIATFILMPNYSPTKRTLQFMMTPANFYNQLRKLCSE